MPKCWRSCIGLCLCRCCCKKADQPKTAATSPTDKSDRVPVVSGELAGKINPNKVIQITPLTDKPIEPSSSGSLSNHKQEKSPKPQLAKTIQVPAKSMLKPQETITAPKAVPGKPLVPFVAPITGITPKKAKETPPRTRSPSSASISAPPVGSKSSRSRIAGGKAKKPGSSSIAPPAVRKSETEAAQSKTLPPSRPVARSPPSSTGSPVSPIRSTDADRERREKTLEKQLLEDKVQQALRKRKERLKSRRNRKSYEPLYDPKFKASIEMLATTRKHMSLINEMQESLSKTRAVSRQSHVESRRPKSPGAAPAASSAQPSTQVSAASSRKAPDTTSAQPSTSPSSQPPPASVQPPSSAVPSSMPTSQSPPEPSVAPSTESPPPSSPSTPAGSAAPSTPAGSAASSSPPPSKKASEAQIHPSAEATNSNGTDDSDSDE